MPRAVDIAWAAGLFEGEGYLHLARSGPQLGLNMNDADVVKRFAGIADCGTVRVYEPPNPKHSTQYRWRVCGWGQVERVVRLLAPHLGQRRRAKIDSVLAARPASYRGPELARAHCPRGHRYDVANTYRDRRGQRHCRACDRDRKRQKARRP